MAELPLSGIRVLELTTGAAGPTVARSLAEFGAEVLRVESRRRPDNHRGGANRERWNKSPTFAKLHRGKKSLTINMQTEQGKKLVSELVPLCDVVVENFSLGVLERWGLSYERLRELRSDIILISLKGLGSTGPHAHHVTWGPNLLCLSGLTYLWNEPDSEIVTREARTQHPDFMAGVAGASAVVAALIYRERSGKGQWIDAAQIEAGASLLGPFYLDYLVNGRDPRPEGNRRPGAAPRGAYPCAGEDKWCVISAQNQEEWERLCRATGHPEWAQDERFATPLARERHMGDLDQLVAEWTRELSARQVMDCLQSAGVAAAPVQDVEDQLCDPHLKARGFFVEMEEPEMGAILTEYPPVRLSETPARVRSPAPLMGQHTEEVLRDLLNLTEEEMESLAAQGVLE